MSFFDTLVKAAVVYAGVSTGVAWFTTGFAGAGAFAGFSAGTAGAFFARSFVTTLVLGSLSRALAKSPDAGAIGYQDQTVTTKQAISPYQVIYGKTRVGGSIVYMESTSNNRYLHIVIALAGHEIQSLDTLYFNDEAVPFNVSTGLVTSGKYTDKARIRVKLGTDDQTAFSELVAESDSKWTSNHRLRGIACIYVRLEFDANVYPNGVPNISCTISGKKVYDPRTATTAYSANAALCLADYLCDTKYGLGATFGNEIDSTALTTAANECDENVSLSGGGTEKRYEINGAFEISAKPESIIQSMLSSMAGKAIYTGGKWKIIAGAYYAPTLTFDEDDVRSGIKIQSLVSRRELFNTVKGTFRPSTDKYISSDFPPITNATYVTQDNNEEIYKDIDLPFTVSASMAQRLAKIELERARQQISLVLPLKANGLKADVGDVIQVTNTRMGWALKTFEVVSTTMIFDDAIVGVDLELRETASSVYDWNSGEQQAFDPAPNTALPNPFTIAAPTNLTMTAQSVIAPDGTLQSNILITWTPVTNSFVNQYEVQYIRGSSNIDWGLITNNATSTVNWGLITNSATTFIDYGSVADSTSAAETDYNTFFITEPYHVITNAIANATYTVRVRAVNILNVKSDFATTSLVASDDTTAPNPPSSLSASPGYKQITLTWINPSVSDFDFVEVYKNTTNNSTTATRIAVIRSSSFVDTDIGINQLRYYWTKAVDRSGNVSGFSSGVSATSLFINSDSFSQEVMNLFQEAGAYGIEPVASLPASGDFDGQIKYDTTANKLYRWDSATSSWTDDIFSITAGSVDLASFASGIEPVSIVNTLPNPSGYSGAKIVFLTTDNKLYRYTGSAWTSAIAAGDVSGEIASSNFPQSLRPVEVVSLLPSSSNFQGRTVLLTTDNKIYRYTGTTWTAEVSTTDLSGTISAGQIAANAITAGKIATDAVTAGTIAAGAVSTDKLAANAVTADKIAANAITATKIASGAVSTDKLEANSITSGKIATGAVSTDQLAAGAITAEKIQTGVITAEKIAAGAIQTDKIAANAITGGLLATSGVITVAAQIENAVITNAKIADGEITASKIATGTITADKLTSNFVYSQKLQVGNTPALAAGGMTGSGLLVNTDGSFAMGNASRSITFDGSNNPKLNGFLNGSTNTGSVTLYSVDISTGTGNFSSGSFVATNAIALIIMVCEVQAFTGGGAGVWASNQGIKMRVTLNVTVNGGSTPISSVLVFGGNAITAISGWLPALPFDPGADISGRKAMGWAQNTDGVFISNLTVGSTYNITADWVASTINMPAGSAGAQINTKCIVYQPNL